MGKPRLSHARIYVDTGPQMDKWILMVYDLVLGKLLYCEVIFTCAAAV